jgi:hypothetical protein
MISRDGIAPLHDVEHVANGRAGGGGGQPDAARKGRQRPFAFSREKALGGELELELFKGGLKRAHALQFHRQHAQLILPARLIDCQLAFQDHLPPVPQGLAVRHRVAAEQHAVDLRAGVFEGEINVAGGLGAAVGDFAGDPDLAELFFQEAADVGRQFETEKTRRPAWRGKSSPLKSH